MAGSIAFPRRNRRLKVGELSPQELQIVFETLLGSQMKFRTFLLAEGKAPGERTPVIAQFPFNIAPCGVKLFNRATKSAQRGGRTKDFVGRFPFHFDTRKPVGVARLPGLLDFVPETFSNRVEISAAIRMQVLNEPPINRLGLAGERRFTRCRGPLELASKVIYRAAEIVMVTEVTRVGA